MNNNDNIRPGDIYKYNCGNNQGYDYMVPVKTCGTEIYNGD